MLPGTESPAASGRDTKPQNLTFFCRLTEGGAAAILDVENREILMQDSLGMNMIETLRFEIKSSGKSLNQIEAEAEIGKGVLSRFVSGSRDLQLETATRLADYLGLVLMPTEDVIGEMFARIDEIADQAAHAQEVLHTVMEGMRAFAELKRTVHAGVVATPSRARGEGESKAGRTTGNKKEPVETYIEISPKRKKPGK